MQTENTQYKEENKEIIINESNWLGEPDVFSVKRLEKYAWICADN